LEKIKLDPFMKEFLSRKGSIQTTSASRVSPRDKSFATRNSSVQIDDVKLRMSQGIIHHMKSSSLTNKFGTGAYEQF
jgi:hypothetical protein